MGWSDTKTPPIYELLQNYGIAHLEWKTVPFNLNLFTNTGVGRKKILSSFFGFWFPFSANEFVRGSSGRLQWNCMSYLLVHPYCVRWDESHDDDDAVSGQVDFCMGCSGQNFFVTQRTTQWLQGVRIHVVPFQQVPLGQKRVWRLQVCLKTPCPCTVFQVAVCCIPSKVQDSAHCEDRKDHLCC